MQVPKLIGGDTPAAIVSVGLLTTTPFCWAGCAFCRLASPLPRTTLFRVPSGLTVDHLDQAPVDWNQVSEVRLRGGLSLKEPLEYWVHLLRILRKKFQGRLTAFSPVEIWQFHQLEGRTLRDIVGMLRWAGVDALGPGGSETWDPEIRSTWAPYRLSLDEWLQTAKAALLAGLSTSCAPIIAPGHLQMSWPNYLAPLVDLDLQHLELKPLKSETTRLSILGDAGLLESAAAVMAIRELRPDLPVLVRWDRENLDDAVEILGAAGAIGITVPTWEVTA